ncbi:MAG: ABC transporter substrate-binding protein, partial [Burkholderiales bacterium]
MKARSFSLFAHLLTAIVVVLGSALTPGWAEAAVKKLIFASAGFHESNRFWTISRPDHLQFEPFWETLVGIDPKTAQYIPMLATKWEHSPDFKEWTFQLRKGVQFHNGYGEFTSADVKHSHSLLIRPDSTATLRAFWATVDEVVPVDSHTVKFRFKHPAMPPSMMFGVSRSGDLRMTSKAQW